MIRMRVLSMHMFVAMCVPMPVIMPMSVVMPMIVVVVIAGEQLPHEPARTLSPDRAHHHHRQDAERDLLQQAASLGRLLVQWDRRVAAEPEVDNESDRDGGAGHRGRKGEGEASPVQR